MSFGLEKVYSSAPRDRVFPNIVCVAGFGSRSEDTWSHGESGKTWIDDPEFLKLLKGSCRVFNFTFNGHVSANLSAAAIAFHANDLLECLEQALGNGNIGPVFFVGHSWGGIIVKKAILLCGAIPDFPKVKRMMAGVLFLGTPHICLDAGAILLAVRSAVSALVGNAGEIQDSDVRQYVAAVRRVNEVFALGKPSFLHLHSFWEQKPTLVRGSSAEPFDQLIVPKSCMDTDLTSNEDTEMECSHLELGRFPSTVDDRFRDFASKMFQMMNKVMMQEDFRDLLSVKKSKDPEATQDKPAPSPKPAPHRGETPKATDPPENIPPLPDIGSGEHLRVWRQWSAGEETKAQLGTFLHSLSGWTEENTGSHISVNADTCTWPSSVPEFKAWELEAGCNMFMFLGEAGQGKTFLAREIVDYLRAVHRSDTVMSFFCTPETGRQAIWEYFTKEFFSRNDMSWFEDLPPRHRIREKDSLPPSQAALLDIWREIRGAGSPQQIYLVVDGIDQCEKEQFEDFFSFLDKLRAPVVLSKMKPVGDRPPMPTFVKVLLTSRHIPAIHTVLLDAAKITISDETTMKDIAAYVDFRLPSLIQADDEKKDKMERLKQEIKTHALAYWPFAKFAVDQVETSLSHTPDMVFDANTGMPVGLKMAIKPQIDTYLRSIGGDPIMTTIVTGLASLGDFPMFTPGFVEDLLRGIYSSNELRDSKLARLVSLNSGQILLGAAEKGVSFVHPSVGHCMADRMSPEQRSANMAFVCLNYLLREYFRNPMPLSKDHVKNRQFLLENCIAYNFAADRWWKYLRDAKELGVQLIPLVRAFMDKNSPQFRNWCSWSDCAHFKSNNISSHTDPIVSTLVHTGCIVVLKELLSPLNDQAGNYWTSVRSFFGGPSSAQNNALEFLELENWPDCVNGGGQTILMTAIMYSPPEAVDFILEWEPDVNAQSRLGMTPLIACFAPSSIEETGVPLSVIERLLERGADPNTPGKGLVTPLHLATDRGSLDAVRLLLDYGACVHATTDRSISALEKAFAKEDTEVASELIRRGADVDALWSSAQVPLTECINADELHIFRILVELADVNGGAKPRLKPIFVACDLPDRHEHLRLLLSRPDLELDVTEQSWHPHFKGTLCNPLTVAARRGNYLAVEMLLEAGAYPGLLPGMSTSPLFAAADAGEMEIVRLLLAHQSPVNAYCRKSSPRTAIGAAVMRDDSEMVAVLLDHGADTTIENGHGDKGPLWVALANPKPKLGIIRQLLEAPIPPDLTFSNKGDDDILRRAVAIGDVELCRLIFDQKPDLSMYVERSTKTSPLHRAVRAGLVEICEIVLQVEPKLLNAQLEEGFQNESPLHMACHAGQPEVVRLLLEKGAHADQISFHDRDSPLMRACQSNNIKCVELLLEAAPQMVNVASVTGHTPLFVACDDDNFEIAEALLKAGADIHHRDLCGTSCMSGSLALRHGRPPRRMLELLKEYGYDINAVMMSDGLTALGTAIDSGSLRRTKWLLEQGADPLKCQQSPSEPDVWRNALQLTMFVSEGDIIDLLLEPRWGLLKSLGDKDSLGDPIWTLRSGLSRANFSNMAKLYHACETYREKTGEDILGKLMHEPDMLGKTIVDIAMGDLAQPPSRRLRNRPRLASWIERLLAVEYDRGLHVGLVEDIAAHLLQQGGFDREAISLLSVVISVPLADTDADGVYTAVEAWSDCSICGQSIRQVCMTCAQCMQFRCEMCVDEIGPKALHHHDWVEVPIQFHADWNPAESREMLEWLRDALTGLVPGPEVEDVPPAESNDEAQLVRPESRQEQGQFNLALLHAFGYLAIKRPLFTPYLPLPSTTEALISPWAALIKGQRRVVERQNLDWETHPARRMEEILYMRRGLRVGYVDEEDVRSGWIVGDVRHMFQHAESEHAEAEARRARESEAKATAEED